ncbi:hypothetical protein IP78_13940 [Brevundimonas sp. AAP58]|uniref:periplasmic heavy metal sensor n=1 Tax=Brevundimonas sp. AAP58 TaxID=1523422 RepID=UPI0006B99494|nr:periplasmic heavy metal sensor [Brevundimonas sp. AAP58]KPF74877.1 hypothetical protein IP78_13940 [Brevundimonas sp. AAP58]
MSSRLLAIVLGIALAVSVGINLFAATAAVTALSGQRQIERALDQRRTDQFRPSTRELLDSLDPEVRRTVRRGLRDAGLAARPDFQAARQARAEAVEAAQVEPFDRSRVEALLTQSREAEARGRARLEGDALALMETLEPEDRRIIAAILAGRARGGERRDREPRQERTTQP